MLLIRNQNGNDDAMQNMYFGAAIQYDRESFLCVNDLSAACFSVLLKLWSLMHLITGTESYLHNSDWAGIIYSIYFTTFSRGYGNLLQTTC